MKKNFTASLALALLSLFLGNSAAAGGFYLGVHGGLTILEDADLAVDNPGAPTLDLTLKTDRGWLAGAAGGYEWSSGVALEGELTYRENELNKVKGMGANIDLGGDENSWAAMANAYYHLHTGTPFTPYSERDLESLNSQSTPNRKARQSSKTRTPSLPIRGSPVSLTH
jgi:opacity protein-like surface antigen